jgi:hypothetical protein
MYTYVHSSFYKGTNALIDIVFNPLVKSMKKVWEVKLRTQIL